MRVLGIDPGLTGALALIETSLDMLVIRDMPVARSGTGTRQEIVPALLAGIVQALDPDVAYLERVNAMPKQGVSSVFTFGQGYGMIRGVLAALRVPVELVTPGHWKRMLHLDQDKTRARAVAMGLFPRDAGLFARVKDHDRAEAALLAWLGLRLSLGRNNINSGLTGGAPGHNVLGQTTNAVSLHRYASPLEGAPCPPPQAYG